MTNVGEALRAEDRGAALRMSPAERVRLALDLGARDLETFRVSHDPPLAWEEAARRLARQRQTGRRDSACMECLCG